jgi:hypothetical protein
VVSRVSILTVLLLTTTPSAIFPVTWDEKAQDRLLEKVQNRAALSQSDETAKAKTLALLPKGEKSGTLYTSKNIQITYVSGKTDNFLVEIHTRDISRAKAEGVKWFRNQGFSNQFICDYPVEFYLNFDLKTELSKTKTIFSPLPPKCQ